MALSLRKRFLDAPPERVLVVRTDRVGDLILSTPFLTELRRHFPKAEITAWVSPYCEQILKESSQVNQVVTSQPSGEFDLAIALAPRSECLKKVMASAAPVRLGYVYKGRPLVNLLAKRCLTDMEVVSIDTQGEVEHEVLQLDRLARRLGMASTVKHHLRLPLKPGPTHDWLTLHLGDRWFTNGWTDSDVARVCYALETFGRLVVTAGPREAELIDQNNFAEFDLRTGLSFQEWCELIAGARVLVSPDTGAVHVAAALQTPVVVAYEQKSFTHCSQQWRPWKVEHRQLVKGDVDETIDTIVRQVKDLLDLKTL